MKLRQLMTNSLQKTKAKSKDRKKKEQEEKERKKKQQKEPEKGKLVRLVGFVYINNSCFCIMNCYRQQTAFAKVMFLHMSVCPRGVSQHALRVSRPTPRWRLRGLARGVSRPTRGGCIQACTEADPLPS